MLHDVQKKIAASVKTLFGIDVEPEVSVPEQQFGDVASNVAMQVAGQVGKNPREIAESIITELHKSAEFLKVEVAGPGFINITVSDETLLGALKAELPQHHHGKVVVTEYSDPNPFKVLHAGHLYTTIIGDVISNLYELSGAEVHRVNFGGDVGLHVAKAMWGIIQELGGEHPEKLNSVPEADRSEWLSDRYVAGNQAYEDGGEGKEQIVAYNTAIYDVWSNDDHDSPFATVYRTCRQWSYDYFDAFYERLGTPFEKYYPESQTAPTGLKTVQEQLKNGVYVESDGAVIFDGDKHDLHKRVFINSKGLPTYEAKDVGLMVLKWDDYHYDESVMITGGDITEYMKVVVKSIEQFMPEAAQRNSHVTHGMVKLKGGVKMSSRLGNFLKASDILDMTKENVSGQGGEETMLAAVKYAFLKQSIGGDIVFDVEESVATQGNSGPYLQYAHARARSILRKSEIGNQKFETSTKLETAERTLVRKLTEYNSVIAKATNELAPHHICSYLYELAQEFNRFYEKNQVIGSDREAARIALVSHYAKTLKSGLTLLGITAPESM